MKLSKEEKIAASTAMVIGALHDAVQTVLEHRFHIHGEKEASICRWGFRKGGARAVVTDVQVDVFAIDPVEGADFIPASYPGINLNHLFSPHPFYFAYITSTQFHKAKRRKADERNVQEKG